MKACATIRCVISLWCLILTEAGVPAEPVEPLRTEDPSSIDALTQRIELLEARLEQQEPLQEAPAIHWLDTVHPGDFPNSILIAGTAVSAKVGGYIKGDLIHDFNAIGSTDNFVTLTIPTDGRDGENTRLHARQTRLNLDVRWPTDRGQDALPERPGVAIPAGQGFGA